VRAFIIVFLLITGAELLWHTASADQAADKDAGVDFGNALIPNVQSLSSTTSSTTVPGYTGTNLPETIYYDTQNLSGLKNDAVIDLGSGATSESGQFAYDQSTIPKMQFNANDPIVTNAGSVGADAVANPEILTVPTGDCAIADVNSAETRIEHCTAWMTPTTHNCNNTLDVNVTWEENSNCPLGTPFNQVQAVHNYARVDDIVYAQAYCNPGAGTDAVAIQLNAHDGSPQCSGWVDATVPTTLPSETYIGMPTANFHGSSCDWNSRTNVPVTATGGCVDDNCSYSLVYYELTSWYRNVIDRGEYEYICRGTLIDLVSLGFSSDSVTRYLRKPPAYSSTSRYCAYLKTPLTLKFTKPILTRTPIVTETWNDGCGYLEAQVPQ